MKNSINFTSRDAFTVQVPLEIAGNRSSGIMHIQKTQWARRTHLSLASMLVAATLSAAPDHSAFVFAGRTLAVKTAGNPMIAVETISCTPNEDGQSQQRVLERDRDQDGIMDERSTSTLYFDKRGNVTNMIGETISIPDNQVQVRFNSIHLYDSRGLFTNVLDETDLNADGIADLFLSTVYTWDARRNLIELATQWRSTWPEVVESTSVETRTYNNRGDIVLSVIKRDDRFVTTTRLTYNSRGLPTSMIIETDSDGDGVPDGGPWRRTFICDRRGLATEILDESLDSDGRVRASARTYNTFDQHRCLTQARTEEDDGADGVIDRVQILTDTYVHRHTLKAPHRSRP